MQIGADRGHSGRIWLCVSLPHSQTVSLACAKLFRDDTMQSFEDRSACFAS